MIMIGITTVMFIVVVVGSAISVRKLVIPESKLGPWANIASGVGGIATALSLILAAYIYYDSAQLQKTLALESAQVQKEVAASSIYQEHMKLSVEHPEFANAEIAPKQPEEGAPPNKGTDKDAYDQYIKDRASYEGYRWYVGHAMLSFESILDVLPDDTGWKETAQGFIRTHEAYIGSRFPCERYTQKIRLLVNETLKKERCSTQP